MATFWVAILFMRESVDVDDRSGLVVLAAVSAAGVSAAGMATAEVAPAAAEMRRFRSFVAAAAPGVAAVAWGLGSLVAAATVVVAAGVVASTEEVESAAGGSAGDVAGTFVPVRTAVSTAVAVRAVAGAGAIAGRAVGLCVAAAEAGAHAVILGWLYRPDEGFSIVAARCVSIRLAGAAVASLRVLTGTAILLRSTAASGTRLPAPYP